MTASQIAEPASRHDPELDPGFRMWVDVVPAFREPPVRWTDCGVNAGFRGVDPFILKSRVLESPADYEIPPPP